MNTKALYSGINYINKGFNMKYLFSFLFITFSALIFLSCSTSTAPGMDPQLSVLSKITGAKKISFTNANNGWAVCTNNKIYKTIDGGKNWLPVTINSAETVTNIQFIDDNNGWCSTYNSIYKTADAGKTWQLILENKNANAFVAMNLVSKDFGMVSGTNDAMIYSTKDGGESWKLINLNAVGKVTSIQFTGSNSGWAAEALGRVYRTDDKGSNWVKTGLEKYTFCIYALDEQTCYAGDCNFLSSLADDNATVYRTENGGKSWVDLNLPNTGLVSKIVFSSKYRGVILADIGNFEKVESNSIMGAQKLIYTNDAGVNWKTLDTKEITIKDICKAGNRILVLLWDDTLLELRD